MRIKSKLKAAVASLMAVTLLVGVPLTVYAGYSPSGRQTYQCLPALPDGTVPCPGADHVAFNSFTNAPNYGDERAFFDGKNSGDTSANGYMDNITVHDGQKLTLRVYIHNNANPNSMGVDAATAHNTTLQVLLPKEVKTNSFAAASVGASNASPNPVNDTVDFNGASPFSVVFDKTLPVQLTYKANGAGPDIIRNVPGASFASDSVMNANFGDWHGCFNYSGLVTMTVIVRMPTTPPPVTPTYTCDLLNIAATVDRKVRVTAFNTSVTNGAVFKNAVIDWGDNTTPLTTNTAVGQTHQYAADGTYTIRATAHFTLPNVNGDVTATSESCAQKVTFKGDTQPPVTPPTTTTTTTTPGTPSTLVNTGPGEVASLFALTSLVGTVAYRFILSRRLV